MGETIRCGRKRTSSGCLCNLRKKKQTLDRLKALYSLCTLWQQQLRYSKRHSPQVVYKRENTYARKWGLKGDGLPLIFLKCMAAWGCIFNNFLVAAVVPQPEQ